MDRIEQTIRRKDENEQKKDNFRYKFFFALAVVFSLSGISSLVVVFSSFINLNGATVSAFDVISLVLAWALAAFFYIKKDDMKIEYDYIIEDDHLIIAKIRNLTSRKEIINIPVSAFKRLDTYNENNFRELDAKKYNCSLNEDAERYVLHYERGERCAVAFEPNEELLKMIKKELNK
jgi:hypothetical protein